MRTSFLVLQVLLAAGIREDGGADGSLRLNDADPPKAYFAHEDTNAKLIHANIPSTYPATDECRATSNEQDCKWPLTLPLVGQYLWIDAPIGSDGKFVEHYGIVRDAWKKAKTKKGRPEMEKKKKELSCSLETLVLKAYKQDRPDAGVLSAYCEKKTNTQKVVTTLRKGRAPGWSVDIVEDLIKRREPGEELQPETEAQHSQKVWLAQMLAEALDQDERDAQLDEEEAAAADAQQSSKRAPGLKNIADMEEMLEKLERGEELQPETEAQHSQKAWLAKMVGEAEEQDEQDAQLDEEEAAAAQLKPEIGQTLDKAEDAKDLQYNEADTDRVKRIEEKLLKLKNEMEKVKPDQEESPEMSSVAARIRLFSQK